MKEKTVCFTGHRHLTAEETKRLPKQLEEIIKQLIQQGCCYFGAGGALGFDTLAAQSVLKLKPDFPHIRLILVLPCVNQTAGWSMEDKKVYAQICNQADKVVYTANQYKKGCMHLRNRHLVNHSGTCVCYLKQAFGGTFYTVAYAKQKGLKMISLK